MLDFKIGDLENTSDLDNKDIQHSFVTTMNIVGPIFGVFSQVII